MSNYDNLFQLGGLPYPEDDSFAEGDEDYRGGNLDSLGGNMEFYGGAKNQNKPNRTNRPNRPLQQTTQQQQQQQAPHVRTNEHNLYLTNMAEVVIALPAYQIKPKETISNLHKLIVGQFSNRCSNDGYVKPGSIEVVQISSGKLDGAFVNFAVTIKYKACNPPPGTVFINACKAISITKAGIRAEITDMSGNVPAEIFIHRDLFSTHVEFNEVKVGDIFSARVINSRFELNDPRISLMCEVYVGTDTEAESTMVGTTSIDSILEIKHLDLDALVATLMSESCAVVRPTPSEYLTVYSLASDSTSNITRAIQEIPILRSKITSNGRVMKSFMEAWNASADMRERIEAAPDITEAKWDLQREFGYRMVTTFMPAYARQIYRHFGAKRILDPCGGWGDRLLGAFTLSKYLVTAPNPELSVPNPADNIVEKYVCFDPNPEVFPGYAEIGKLMRMPVNPDMSTKNYLRFENGFEAHQLPFEVGAEQLASDSFDLVFTSPPFFDYEIYSETNPTYRNWIDDFYRPLMVQSHRCVQMGGHVCIHIDDTSAGAIEPFLRKEVEKMVGLELVGRIGLVGTMSKKIRSVWVYVKVA
jgi:hypothetical protein